MDGDSKHCTGGSDQDHVQGKKKRQNSFLRKTQMAKEKSKDTTHLNAEFQRIARRDKKAFQNDQCKEVE